MLIKHYLYYPIVTRSHEDCTIFLRSFSWHSAGGHSPPWMSYWVLRFLRKKRKAYRQVGALISSIKRDQGNDQRTLQRLFHKVHSSMLKRYQAYADFRTLFTEGTYDCLTATTLFSHLLTNLKYDFKVIETNYHIFILVETSRGQVMLETTDRLGALWQIAMWSQAVQVITGRTILLLKRMIDSRINTRSAFTRKFLRKSFQACYCTINQSRHTIKGIGCHPHVLWRAHAIYATPRCEELGDILVRTVMETNTPASIRHECMARLQRVLMARAGTMASK